MASVYDFDVKTIDGMPKTLAEYRGKAMLIVNVASRCGLTPQYQGLQKLYEQYEKRGFVVLGFPCNQFKSQEPGTSQEIKSFCEGTYQVTFPLFEKIDVNGDTTHPLYAFLKRKARGVLWSTAIKWNFSKFLVAPDGRVLKRFAPTVKPEELRGEIEKILPA